MTKYNFFKIQCTPAYLWISAVLILSACILFGSLIFGSHVWVDEIYTISEISIPYLELLQILTTDVHPPLYFVGLKVFCDIFGYNLIVMHIFSLLAILGMFAIGFFPVRHAFGEKTSLWFMFLCLTMPCMMWYSNEIRMYSWAMFFVTACCLSAIRVFQSGKLSAWICFVLFGIFASYTHNYALIGIGLIVLSLGMYMWLKKREDIKKWILASGIIGVAYIPWFVTLLGQVSGVNDGFWITLNLNTLLGIPFGIFTLHSQFTILNAFFIGFIGIISLYFLYRLFTTKPWTEKEWISLACVLIISLILIFTIGYSIIIQPVVQARYIMTLFGLGLLFFSIMLSSIQNRKLVVIFVCVMIGATGVGYCSNYLYEYNTDMVNAISQIDEKYPPNAIFIYDGGHAFGVMGHYLPERVHLTVATPEGVINHNTVYTKLLNGKAVTPDKISEYLSEEKSIYLIEVNEGEVQPILSDSFNVNFVENISSPLDSNYKLWSIYSVNQ